MNEKRILVELDIDYRVAQGLKEAISEAEEMVVNYDCMSHETLPEFWIPAGIQPKLVIEDSVKNYQNPDEWPYGNDCDFWGHYEYHRTIPPLKFAAEMMDRLLDGSKTQTRRPVDPMNPLPYIIGDRVVATDGKREALISVFEIKQERLCDIVKFDIWREGFQKTPGDIAGFIDTWDACYQDRPEFKWGNAPIVHVLDIGWRG